MRSYPTVKNSIIDYIVLNTILCNEENGISYAGVYSFLVRKGLCLEKEVSLKKRSNFYKKCNSLRDKGFILEKEDSEAIRLSYEGKNYLKSIKEDVDYIISLLNDCFFIKGDTSLTCKDIMTNDYPLLFMIVKSDDYNIICNSKTISFRERGVRSIDNCNIIFVNNNTIVGACVGRYDKINKVININKFIHITKFIDISSLEGLLRINNKITRVSDETKQEVLKYL